MCGFAGFLDPDGRFDLTARSSVAKAMADALAARGPDDEGLYLDICEPITLAFRRLAIIDLSAAGRQPMIAHDGRHVLTFNGEIYNFEDIRDALDREQPTTWRGGSDSEVLLEALARWGVSRTLRRADGMFALALWDRLERRLVLARDRFGEKPLFYGWQDGCFLFGSTLRALSAHPGLKRDVSPTALSAFFARGFVPGPHTIYEGIAKLPPGHWLEISGLAHPGTPPNLTAYFDPITEAEAAAASPFAGTIDDALEAFDDLLARSVQRRLRSDVPVGVFLSGGIDSSSVAAMAAAEENSIATFTISFTGSPEDEAPFARAVANHLRTAHTEFPVTAADAFAGIDKIADFYDEPFADPSAIPSIILCQQARRHVKVALSGDGGDEFFCGYSRYGNAARDFARAEGRPAGLRRLAAATVPLIPNGGMKRSLLRHSIATPRDAYLPYLARWRWRSPSGGIWNPPEWAASSLPPISQFLVADVREYLPDDLQTKMDRASMGVGLEVRAPLLNAEIARFAWSLPIEWRLAPKQGAKFLLRRALARRVPPQLFERPKQGFYQPLPSWLRGDLREWAEDELSEAALQASGLIDPEPVRAAWKDHLRGRNRALDLWVVLMFQQWVKVARNMST